MDVPELSGFFEPAAIDPSRPDAAVISCIESGCPSLLLDSTALPPEFFDLSSGVLGALLNRLTIYGLRMAAVVPDLERRSVAFRDFAREANRGVALRIAPTREAAIAWLSED